MQLLWAIATTSDDISILACEGEAHLAAQDEEYYGFALEVLGTLSVMAEVTLGVKINRILALWLLEVF